MTRLSAVLAAFALLGLAQAAPGLYFKAADDRWQCLPVMTDRGTLRFTLDPARLRAGRTLLLVSPDPTLYLDDAVPPQLQGLKLAGRPLPVDQPTLDLDWLAVLPRDLVAAVRDEGNALLPASLTVSVDGRPLPSAALRYEPADAKGRAARLTARLTGAFQPQATHHTIDLRLTDTAPEHNALVRHLRFWHLDAVTADPLVLVDSCFPGYENTEVLVDGKHGVPGQTTVGVTWASREEPGDHWVVLAWPRPRTIESLRLHWAYYQNGYWAARRLVVQTWDGRAWVTRWQTEANPSAPSTSIPLGGLTTDRLRLIQPDGGGNPAKGPNIFWLDEIEVQ